MRLRKHPSATCRRCGGAVWYGLKPEGDGWKVLCECDPRTGCGREWSPGRIPMRAVDSRDEAAERAAALCERSD